MVGSACPEFSTLVEMDTTSLRHTHRVLWLSLLVVALLYSQS